MTYTLTGIELPYITPPDVTKERWAESLKAEKDRIIINIANALGYEGTDVAEAIQYIRSVPPDEFSRVIAGPAAENWAKFFGSTPGTDTPAAIAALKMLTKIQKASAMWGARLAEAFDPETGYYAQRVDQAKDYYAQLALGFRFTGDPPRTPIGVAPWMALLLTGGYVPAKYVPADFSVEGEVFPAFDPMLANYVRPIIVAVIVQNGVYARYALDAGLRDVADSFLQRMVNALNKLAALKADNVDSITFSADVYSHPSYNDVIRITVTVQEVAGG